MRKMTESNLLAAFAGESQAHTKYAIFAERARQDGFAQIARLFEAASFAERVHATAHLRELGKVQTTDRNLQSAIDGETEEAQEMYPAFKAVAELEGESGAVRSIIRALEAEKLHAALYANARSAVRAGHDMAADTIQVCEICGHTVLGQAPERCPVCGAAQNRFRAF